MSCLSKYVFLTNLGILNVVLLMSSTTSGSWGDLTTAWMYCSLSRLLISGSSSILISLPLEFESESGSKSRSKSKSKSKSKAFVIRLSEPNAEILLGTSVPLIWEEFAANIPSAGTSLDYSISEPWLDLVGDAKNDGNTHEKTHWVLWASEISSLFAPFAIPFVFLLFRNCFVHFLSKPSCPDLETANRGE